MVKKKIESVAELASFLSPYLRAWESVELAPVLELHSLARLCSWFHRIGTATEAALGDPQSAIYRLHGPEPVDRLLVDPRSGRASKQVGKGLPRDRRPAA